MAMEEKLKDYMESAGKNDAISVFDQGKYTVNSEEDIEERLKEMNNDMLYDWSSVGFDFLNEKEMMEEEIGQKLDDDEIHKIAASAFEAYYIPAFLDEFKSLATESFQRKDVESRKTTIQISEKTRHKLQQWDEIHYIGHRRSYDEIIQEILKNETTEEPDFLKWHLNNSDKLILNAIRKGCETSGTIREELRKDNIELSLRSVQVHLDSLTTRNLIIRIKGGKEHSYKLNGKIL
jgi:uncharacterized membrane protein